MQRVNLTLTEDMSDIEDSIWGNTLMYVIMQSQDSKLFVQMTGDDLIFTKSKQEATAFGSNKALLIAQELGCLLEIA